MIALLDNTVLSNFSVVERADLVRRALGEDAATTQAVWDELQAGVRMGRLPAQDWSWLPILSLLVARVTPITKDDRDHIELLHIYGRRCSLQITPHQLRHSYAALLFNTGVLILTVQAPLGHPCLPQGKCKFLDVTLGYGHICEGRVTSDHNRRVRISINLM